MVLCLTAMDDDDQFYTYEENQEGFIEREFLGESSGSMGSQESADHLVDELQALNTALCFLCSINADSNEVQTFLKIHPEALLLEGACLLPEDSAHYILEQRSARCQCQGPCHTNRTRVLNLLNIGFTKFQARRELRSPSADQSWSMYFVELVKAEHDIRVLRRNELQMRNTLVETAVEVRCYREEMEHLRVISGHSQFSIANNRPSALAMLGCSRSYRQELDRGTESRMAVLEYQIGVASVNLRSVEREHATLLQNIRGGRRKQFSVLQQAFEGCHRHEICSNKK